MLTSSYVESDYERSFVASHEHASPRQSQKEDFIKTVNCEIRSWMRCDDDSDSGFIVKYRGESYSFIPKFLADGTYQLWLGSGESDEEKVKLTVSNDNHRDFVECGWFVYGALFGPNKEGSE